MSDIKRSKVLSYGEFQGSIEVSLEDNCLFGRILHIDDVVTYEADSPQELEKSFRDAVDEYISFCNDNGLSTCKPYKGVFNVRVSPDMHKKAASLARKQGISLNELVNQALIAKINKESKAADTVIHNHNHEYFITVKEQDTYDLEDVSRWLEKPKLSLVQ
jgi:predicted HicB family RNase H-like nuclease